MPSYAKSERLRQRVVGLSKFESHVEISLNEILSTYVGKQFRDTSIDKEKFFRECLTLELSKESEKLLLERCKLDYHRDVRSTVEYGLDLTFGWLSEDLVLKAIENKGVRVELAGEDRHREFLPRNEIGASSDFNIECESSFRPLEIVFSWNNYWKNTDTWDIRDSKFKQMTNPNNESLCLGIELPSLHGFLVDMKIAKELFFRSQNQAWGNKASYSVKDMRAKLRSIDNVLEEVAKI